MAPGSVFLPSSKDNFPFCYVFDQEAQLAKPEVLHPSELLVQFQSCFLPFSVSVFVLAILSTDTLKTLVSAISRVVTQSIVISEL